MQNARDRGAAAVEFALVSTLLILLLAAIVDGGRLWMTQSSLSHAAREGAREMAIHNVQADAEAVIEGYPFLSGIAATGHVQPPTCTSGATVRAEARYTATTFLGGISINMVGRAEMRCGG